MPPIPIYSHSPINPAKAKGPSPQTADTAQNMTPVSNPATTTAAASQAYPPAQPGASPAIAAPTSSAQAQYSPLQPTPTQPLSETQGPPPPQPGAVPIAVLRPPKPTSTLPPPPKAGEAVSKGPGPTAAPQVPYPPQMHIPPPTGTSAAVPGAQRGTLTAFVAPAAGPSPLEHPLGYQQRVEAGEMGRYQRARQDALDEEDRGRQGSLGGDGGAGAWDSAMKMVAAAGEKLSAAESEVWRRINKGE